MGVSKPIKIKNIHTPFHKDPSSVNSSINKIQELLAIAMYEYYINEKNSSK